MADNVNQRIADALTHRHLRALRFEAGLRRQVLEQLAVLESEILASLKANDPTEFVLLARRRRAIETLMTSEIDPLIQERYARLAALIDAALLRLGRQEATALETIVNDVARQEIIEEQPSDRQLRAGIVNGIFPSAAKPTDMATVGADWWTRAGTSLSQRIGDSLTTGVALEESLVDLSRRIKGTSENGFQDGVMSKGRADAARLLTTQVTNALGETRAAVATANPARLLLLHQSVLDSRTSLVCLGRNGLKYTADTHEGIGHDVPYLNGVPYHPSCRSSIVLVLQDGGAVAQESTAQWLRRQGPAVQDEVLGPTRAQLFRDGKLGPRDLIDSLSGRPLTLEELGV